MTVITKITSPTITRFKAKVRQTKSCWTWTAGTDTNGYGQFKINGIQYGAHRVAYVIATGTNPNSLCVLHSCDNPPCVNPDHLSLGTMKDNNADRGVKGRTPKGSAHHRTQLEESDVLQIRARKKLGESNRMIAKDYPVTPSTVGDICRRKTWTHVP